MQQKCINKKEKGMKSVKLSRCSDTSLHPTISQSHWRIIVMPRISSPGGALGSRTAIIDASMPSHSALRLRWLTSVSLLPSIIFVLVSIHRNKPSSHLSHPIQHLLSRRRRRVIPSRQHTLSVRHHGSASLNPIDGDSISRNTLVRSGFMLRRGDLLCALQCMRQVQILNRNPNRLRRGAPCQQHTRLDHAHALGNSKTPTSYTRLHDLRMRVF